MKADNLDRLSSIIIPNTDMAAGDTGTAIIPESFLHCLKGNQCEPIPDHAARCPRVSLIRKWRPHAWNDSAHLPEKRSCFIIHSKFRKSYDWL